MDTYASQPKDTFSSLQSADNGNITPPDENWDMDDWSMDQEPAEPKGRRSGGGRVDKRDKYREKNRVAAAKCRAKKKEHIDGLEESHRTQSMLNALLKQTAQTLRDELSFWRTQALQHGYCDCKAIQEYNMRKARALAADGEFGQTEAALDQLDSAPFSGSEDVDVNLIA